MSPCENEMGATVTLNVKQGTLADVQKQLGMKEGFDVGLEMSGATGKVLLEWETAH